MIGANLARRLISDGYRVFLMMRPGSDRSRLGSIINDLEILEADMTDGDAVKAAVDAARPEIVIHMASTPWIPTPKRSDAYFRVNVLGNLYLIEALQNFPRAKVVFTGSSSVYGGGAQLREDGPLFPGTLYGASKASASILIQTFSRLHQMQTVELRLFTPYGPWEGDYRLIPHVILSALAGNDVPLTQGDQERDFVFVDDVVDAIILAATRLLPAGSVYNIGSGVGTSVKTVAKLILGLMGNPVKLRFGELPTRPDEIMEMSADISAARKELGWRPQISLEDGLRKSIAWFTERRTLDAT